MIELSNIDINIIVYTGMSQMFNAVTYLKIINKKLNSYAQYNKCILFGTYCLNNMRLKL